MASLKDQLEQAGYDTSNLDEAAVMKQLNDSGYDTSSFAASSVPSGMVAPAAPKLMGDLVAPTNSSNVTNQGNGVRSPLTPVSNAVEAGYSGGADLVAGNGLSQAAQDVHNVLNDASPETTAGKVGKFGGSFFTPTQIALNAAGGAVAKPIAEGLGKVASPIVKGLVNNFPKLSEMLGVEPEALNTLIDNPEGVQAAQSAKEMAEDAGSYLKGISKKGMAAAKSATNALSDETPVEGAVDAAQSGLQKLTSADVDAPGMKDTLNSIIKSLGKDPSEANVQDAIDKLDDITKFNAQNPTDASKVIKSVRQDLSELLKAQNNAYKTGMEASSATREPLKALSQNLGVKNGLPSDGTIRALSKLNNPDALATQRALTILPGGGQLASNAASSVAKDALKQSLLGKLALNLIPNIGGLTSGAVKAIPTAANTIYQGLQD